MIYTVNCAALSVALEQLKKIVVKNEENGRKTVIFCEDRLSLAAERTVCSAVEGTFLTSVFTLARFLSSERGKAENVLSSQGSAMAVRKIIEDNKNELTLFKKLSVSGAAQAVYDTIALLYSSRVSAEDAAKAAEGGGILGGKLHDLAIIYAEYEKYLKESGKEDRNAYLRQLGEVVAESNKIKGNSVVFLGFQAFTCTSAECVRAACSAAESVYGLFIGGAEDVYVNEASSAFIAIANEFGGAEISTANDGRIKEAQVLCQALYNADCFYGEPLATDKVNIYEAADTEEELEFIAVNIKKHVSQGERYAKISVMLPDLENGERALARVFARYKIPYYADKRLSLSEHSLCAFVINYLVCAVTGCQFPEVDAIVASPYFPAERAQKDLFRNYLLRLAPYRGGVKRTPKDEALSNLGFDKEAVECVRKEFLKGLDFIAVKGGISSICGGLRALLTYFKVENTLKDFSEKYKDTMPIAAQFSSRAYESLLTVLDEAESISGGGVSLNEFVKILKSGLSAMKISLIPPKADAVFVGDLAATANTGSNVVFAAQLTGEVPCVSSDTSLLTDREISALSNVNLNISPKISQVNARKRETCALNICAFRNRLYLSYPVKSGGEESGASELISYAAAAFRTPKGAAIEPVSVKKVETLYRAIPYYCSEKLPAIKYLRKYAASEYAPSVYKVLASRGFETEASAALKMPVKRGISCGQRLYLAGKTSLSPTALETYFSCPYLGFMRQGLKVQEREEGVIRAVDTGNFIHSVLQDMAKEVGGTASLEEFSVRTRSVAEEKLSKPPYSSLVDSKSGKYLSEELLSEAVKISGGMYEQIKNSSFTPSKAECGCEVQLSGVKIYGRIDRVDESGDLVRIIDYKTGSIDATASKYYTGAKLQLPLYLLAVSEGKRAAGAYYFPASVEYRDKKDGIFRLQGFMDGSDEVVIASDSTVQPKMKSDYVNAFLGGGRSESAMSRSDFSDFLEYSKLVASVGATEMLSGNIAPSPAEGTCRYCKAGGSCGVSLGKDGEERKPKSVKCSQIAELVRKVKGDGNATD
ncbi:MAG: PD-(D/E)XK nuclease family protein [Clostridia bacterium]|nr:PD-(D/E)XK nuclease family protein [Clostridia bacterium]